MAESGDDKIRMLIVDDIPETRENLKKLLFFETDIEVVGTATNGNEGVDLARELKPDVVLMDINMPGLDGIQASELITQHSPYTQIIIMSVQSEADYLRRSMLAGAREFLIKPFTGTDLITSIRRVHQLGVQQRERMPRPAAAGDTPIVQTANSASQKGKLIALFSPKGGVGCSTLAINLAIAMQKGAQAKVAIVDASLFFGDIAVLMNLQARRSIVDLAPHAAELDTDLIETVMVTHDSGVKVLLAPPRPEQAEMVPADAVIDILLKLQDMFDIVFVDMYSSLQDTVVNILDIADLIILVTTPEIPSIKSAKLFFEVTHALEYPEEKTQMVLNKADRRTGIRAADIEAGIKRKVMAHFPLDEKAVITAVNQGVPYIISNSNSELSKATITYARKLHQFVTQKS